VNADHLLHLKEIEDEGYVRFGLSCEHGPLTWSDRWSSARYGGYAEECWLMSYWEGIGQELLSDDVPWPANPTFPLPVTGTGSGEDVAIVYAPGSAARASETVGCPADTRGDR
jgi:hypothetical protein